MQASKSAQTPHRYRRSRPITHAFEHTSHPHSREPETWRTGCGCSDVSAAAPVRERASCPSDCWAASSVAGRGVAQAAQTAAPGSLTSVQAAQAKPPAGTTTPAASILTDGPRPPTPPHPARGHVPSPCLRRRRIRLRAGDAGSGYTPAARPPRPHRPCTVRTNGGSAVTQPVPRRAESPRAPCLTEFRPKIRRR